MNICQPWESIKDCLELFAECFGCELDFSDVEGSDSRNLETGADLCR